MNEHNDINTVGTAKVISGKLRKLYNNKNYKKHLLKWIVTLYLKDLLTRQKKFTVAINS